MIGFDMPTTTPSLLEGDGDALEVGLAPVLLADSVAEEVLFDFVDITPP
jgi:hypothetical protein